MKNKKHIDNLFKEGFKNFEATPSPDVWANIQAKIAEEKDDRKVIPLWWKLAGVAALIALLVTIGISVNNNQIETPSITTTEKPLENITTENQIEKNNQVVSEDVLNSKENSEYNSSEDNTIKNNYNSTKNSSVTSSEEKNSIKEKSKNTVVSSSNEKKSFLNNSAEKKNVVASTNTSEATKLKNSSKETRLKKDNLEKADTSKNTSEAVAVEKMQPKENLDNELKDSNNAENIDTKNAIAKNETDVTKKSESEKKSIFDSVAEKDKTTPISVKETPENRWIVAPNVAPVYYSSLGNGSSLDESLSDNQKNGDVNLSYGVQVSYAINKKLSIRSGISNVNLSYSTGGVEVGTGPIAAAPRGVNYNNGNGSAVLFAVDKGTLATLANTNNGEFGNIVPKSTKGDAFINQKLNYVEVPLELKYALLDTKIGVNLIGGLSSLFLSTNEVSVSADNFDTVIGEANNLNSISFTTNIGLGLDYKISKKFLFNIEPMFKYQLNPYTDSQVSFKPYYLGVYTGFSFKF